MINVVLFFVIDFNSNLVGLVHGCIFSDDFRLFLARVSG